MTVISSGNNNLGTNSPYILGHGDVALLKHLSMLGHTVVLEGQWEYHFCFGAGQNALCEKYVYAGQVLYNVNIDSIETTG